MRRHFKNISEVVFLPIAASLNNGYIVSPLQHYLQACQKKGLHTDAIQQQAVVRLDDLYQRLLAPHEPSLLQRLLGRPLNPIVGIYLWGGVGRGKTFVTDLFYNCLPFNDKRRVHFHRFMQQVHAELQGLPKTPDPLKIVAKNLAKQFRLLVLDEFHVSDIADAMLLAGLLQALFENGVTLVTTSNIPLSKLYQNGLQRERFLPAITLLQQHTESIEMNGTSDYRLNLLEKDGTYHCPIEESTEALLKQQFNTLISGTATQRPLQINGREIITHKIAGGVAWFRFPQICQTPRSASDYLEVARCFHTVIISDIPRIHVENDGVAKRFIDLIDALYDHRVKLLVSADQEPESLYLGERLAFPFQRTISRLHEMRSQRYLAEPHSVE
ncbi:MAG: AFG1 family ATPase [Gammaproteobacteria bacterium]|nr:AFG1 family ATPase [Gammaproteobacteria bacterium]MCF6231410.1 AFG1 family ATPase [Gammaproteobacteria bacterium]